MSVKRAGTTSRGVRKLVGESKINDVYAPSSTITIVEDVRQWLEQHNLGDTQLFEHYDDAVKAVWPSLYIANSYAGIFIAINVYLECAEILGFEVKPDFLKTASKDGLI
jgi:hypothetical protein